MVQLTGRVPSSVQELARGVSDQEILFSHQGGVLVAAIASPYEYLTLKGRRYCASAGTHAGLAVVTAVPTTAAAWVLYNPGGNDMDFVIDSIGSWQVSGTSGLGLALLCAVTLGDQTTAPTDVALSIKTNLNGGVFNSKGIFGVNHTITGGTPAWDVVAARDNVAAVSIGSGLHTGADFPGTRVIQPGRELAITHLGGDGTTELYGVSVTWHEVQR